MATAKITLIGLYQYLNENNIDLFSEIVLPPNIDKSTLIDSILLRGAEFEILYADSDMFRYAIGAWSKKYANTLKKWADVLEMVYDPLENYDRKEDWADNKAASSDVKNNSISQNSTKNDLTSEDMKAAFNSSSYSPYTQNTTGSTANSSDIASADTKAQQMETSAHKGRIHGNIGVKTTQSMLLEQWEVAKLSVYEAVAELFLAEFTIYTY